MKMPNFLDVSVPFPGILFLNTGEPIRTKRKHAFPSPSRGSYFSIKIVEYDWNKWLKVSVPFPGILFLNIHPWFYRFMLTCFRPLPGDLISQLLKKKLMVAVMVMVSVPFPGILFLNR